MSSGSQHDLPRRLFAASVGLVVLGGTFAYGAFAQGRDLPPLPQVRAAFETVRGNSEVTNHPRRHHLQPTRGQGDGVTVDTLPDDGTHVLMAGFFDDENQVRLVARDGTVERTWSLDYFEHFPDPDQRACELESPLGVDTHGLVATPQGEVVVTYEYCGTVKLDACGELLWSIADHTHHSVVPAEAGGYWLLGRDEWGVDERPDHVPDLFTTGDDELFHEDTILRVDEDGEVVDEVVISEVLLDNGFEALLTANPSSVVADVIEGGELVHANKVAELPSAIADAHPGFDAGDLAISMRNRNLLMVVDPDSWTVTWHQVGPWLRQHDPEFRDDGRISIFNNNVYGTAYVDDRTDLSAPFTTNIMVVDPTNGETDVVFGEAPGQEMLSVVRGQHELLDDGGMLITEFDGGRVLQVDGDGEVVWEYVNAHDDEFVGEVTDAHVVPADLFDTDCDA